MPVRYSVTVPGRPVPKKAMRRGQKRQDPRAAATLAYQEEVGWRARQAGVPRMTGPVSLGVRAYVKDDRRGDLANYVKAAEDGLQVAGVLRNDRHAMRYVDGTGIYYDANERLEIDIEVIER